jgi:hypothetical protein
MKIEPAVRSIRPEWLGEIIWYTIKFIRSIMVAAAICAYMASFPALILGVGYMCSKMNEGPEAVDRKYHSMTTGRIELRQMAHGSTGGTPYERSSGWFFLIGGSYDSESGVTPESKTIRVMGKVDGSYRFIEFPFEDARFVIDDNITEPYIQIEYTGFCVRNDEKTEYFRDEVVVEAVDEQCTHAVHKNRSCINNSPIRDRIYKIYCPSQYLPEQLNPLTL